MCRQCSLSPTPIPCTPSPTPHFFIDMYYPFLICFSPAVPLWTMDFPAVPSHAMYPLNYPHMAGNHPIPKARRTQTNNAQLYLAEPYSVHNQIAYAMNNAEPLCAGVWAFGLRCFL